MLEKFEDYRIQNIHQIKGGTLNDDGYVPRNKFEKNNTSVPLTTTDDD